MKSLIIIPVRFNSTRLPGKPMKLICGKPMIQWVYEQCLKSNADNVVVATDSETIKNHMESIGCDVYMTGDVDSGTNRILECVKLNKELQEYSSIINVQGDEPFIDPEDINQVIISTKRNSSDISTLVTKLKPIEYSNRNVVKAYINSRREVLMFTRSNLYGQIKSFYKHLGIYGYNIKVLELISKMSKTSSESIDNLEQLRWLDNGLSIKSSYTDSPSIGVDTQKDLDNAIIFAQNEFQS